MSSLPLIMIIGVIIFIIVVNVSFLIFLNKKEKQLQAMLDKAEQKKVD